MTGDSNGPIEAGDVEIDELVGSAVQRREDRALLVGEAEYTDDIQYPRMGYLALVRSRHAHARIEDIDTSTAENLDGVIAVYTARDIEASSVPGRLPGDNNDFATCPRNRILETGKVRYQGEPIAAVVADDRYTAHDARDEIDVAYEPLDAVVDPVAGVDAGAPVIHADVPDNVCFEWETGDEDAVDRAFAEAATTMQLDLTCNRLLATPLEPRVAVAQYKPAIGELTIDLATQHPHDVQRHLSEILDISAHRIHVRSPDVGGGFGVKSQPYPGHVLTAWCAMQLGRPVKWQNTRSADFQSTAHARRQTMECEAALDETDRLLGMRVRTHADMGAYLQRAGSVVPTRSYSRTVPGPYEIPAVHMEVVGVFTNTVPTSAYRGGGRPAACYLMERLMDTVARERDRDPVAFRRRHFISPDEFPYETPLGYVYDSGRYELTLEEALDIVDYDEFRSRQARLREKGRYLGIGFSCYVDACGVGPGRPASSLVRVKPSGEVIVQVGTHSHGQGHETSFAQIAANRLGIPYDDIRVVEGDTAQVPEGHGTGGSRSGPVGGSAVAASTDKILAKARRIAAHELETAQADLEFEAGEFTVRGAPSRSIHIQDVAERAYKGDLPDGLEPGLEATSFYDPPNYTFPFGTHVAIAEVRPETGEVNVERYVAVDDCGTRINPKIVEGQVHGGVAQGIAQALQEEAVYDDNGTLLTSTLQDYAIPKASDVSEFETASTVTEAPHNPLGVKGVGESGAIASPPAIVNAVVDALSPLGIDHIEMPLTSEKVWQSIVAARPDT